MCVFPLLWFYVVEKVAAVFRFLSNKIKLTHKRKKEEKKHETQNKKISATPPNFFGRLAVFHSLTHGRTKSSETKFEPRKKNHPPLFSTLSNTTHTHTSSSSSRAFRDARRKKKGQNETPGLVVKKAVRSFLSVLIFLCLLLQSN